RAGYFSLDDLRIHERFSMAYLSGTHNLKIGTDLNQFSQGLPNYNNPYYVNQATSYTFRDRVPQSVTIWNGPYGPYQKATENNLFPHGERGQWNDLTFGQTNVAPSTHRAEDALKRFNKQTYNWQGSISVQRQLASNMSINVGYFRTAYGGFLAMDNRAVTPAD